MSLYPPEREKLDPKDYERVPVNVFVEGIIEEVQYDAAHNFKGMYARVAPAIRFKFKIEGLNYSHYSRWGLFSYSEKSNIYLKYLIPLVEGATPDMKFDIKKLEGLPIKMVWADDPRNPDFQSVQIIVPLNGKIKSDAEVSSKEVKGIVDDLAETIGGDDEEVAF